MNLDKDVPDEPARSEGESNVLRLFVVLAALSLLIWLFVSITKTSVDGSHGVVTAESEVSIAVQAQAARQDFAQGNYITHLDQKKLQASSQVPPDSELKSCQESGAICLFNSIAFKQDPATAYLRESYLAEIPQDYLMAPHAYGYAVSCRSTHYDKRRPTYSTFLLAGSPASGEVGNKLRQYVALIHRQTGAVPVVHGADSELTHRFYALSGSSLPSMDGLIYRFSLNNGFLWVTGIARNGEGQVVTVFEPHLANTHERIQGEKPLCY